MSQLSRDAIQEQLGSRYVLKRKIGGGAAGSVYLVEDLEREGLLLALKVLTNAQAFDENTIERFCEEIEISRTIRHKNLVRALDFVPIGSTVAYTMEFVEGEDLARQLEKGKKFSAEQGVWILSQVLDGVGTLHEKGIVHRDLKLENILIRKDGVVKVSDLGLVKRLDADGLTKTGLLLGTAQYMPPEYVKAGTYDVRSDLYAIGVMAVEMFSGKRRLAGKKGNQALDQLLKEKFAVPEIILKEIPRHLRSVIEKAISPNPRSRFDSAHSMKREIERAYRRVTDGKGEFSSQLSLKSFREAELGKGRKTSSKSMAMILGATAVTLVLFFVLKSVGG